MKDFGQLGLSSALIRATGEMGFVTPTEIQARAIPELLEGDKDLVGLAQTGTGKTAAFGLPMIDLIDPDLRAVQGLVLAPTRELCLQITNELTSFSKFSDHIKIVAVYGGADIRRQMNNIRAGANIIVATPGRLRDLIRRKAANLKQVRYLVLDEADEMLNMGFKEEIDDILTNTPEEKHTWLFSATMPDEVRRISSNYMTDPIELTVGHKNSGNKDIDHRYIVVKKSQRVEALKRFLDFDNNTFGLVFCRTRRDTKELADQLSMDGYAADALNGDLSQAQRDRVMDLFRKRRIKILVATDVAARGIDVQDITHVFHFNIPDDLSFYTHRSGRTGRAGNKGTSLVFAHPKDQHLLRRLERKVKIKFSSIDIPRSEAILQKQLSSRIQKIKDAEINPLLKEHMPLLMEELGEFSKEEIIERFASLSFAKILKSRKRSTISSKNGSERSNGRRSGDENKKRLFINIGSMDLRSKGEFIKLLCEETGITGDDIGQIEMQSKHSYFDIESAVSQKVIQQFNKSVFNGREIRVNPDDQRGGGGRGGRGKGGKKFKKDKRKKDRNKGKKFYDKFKK